ncbi:uncharacterized protein AB675_4073 [Cyphellophora attinorum]|uniref:Uncharacterized protein n=1 Tax=Cyphellophora attinorum TaxID=1664694 RepID=A0A0N1HK42_9EURO|nr:uncharacterized protein AB675_4073 [Phialophora attinorum]KPI34487.1 hypothetical protein AB675_4073 [Phialophora attinorum]
MFQTLSTPSWAKAEPNLVSMPREILERIISFAIPDSVCVTTTYVPGSWKHDRPLEWVPGFWKQGRPFKWDPDWVSGLLAVSKRLRKVARSTLAQRVQTIAKVQGSSWYHYHYPRNPARVDRATRDYFTKVLTRNEEQTLHSA